MAVRYVPCLEDKNVCQVITATLGPSHASVLSFLSPISTVTGTRNLCFYWAQSFRYFDKNRRKVRCVDLWADGDGLHITGDILPCPAVLQSCSHLTLSFAGGGGGCEGAVVEQDWHQYVSVWSGDKSPSNLALGMFVWGTLTDQCPEGGHTCNQLIFLLRYQFGPANAQMQIPTAGL